MNIKAKVIIALCTFCVMSVFAEPQGWGLGMGTFDDDFGVQARKDFTFGEELQYAIDIQAALYNQSK